MHLYLLFDNVKSLIKYLLVIDYTNRDSGVLVNKLKGIHVHI